MTRKIVDIHSRLAPDVAGVPPGYHVAPLPDDAARLARRPADPPRRPAQLPRAAPRPAAAGVDPLLPRRPQLHRAPDRRRAHGRRPRRLRSRVPPPDRPRPARAGRAAPRRAAVPGRKSEVRRAPPALGPAVSLRDRAPLAGPVRHRLRQVGRPRKRPPARPQGPARRRPDDRPVRRRPAPRRDRRALRGRPLRRRAQAKQHLVDPGALLRRWFHRQHCPCPCHGRQSDSPPRHRHARYHGKAAPAPVTSRCACSRPPTSRSSRAPAPARSTGSVASATASSAGSEADPWPAHCSSRSTSTPASSPRPRASLPGLGAARAFTDPTPGLPRGVHLHWALPDVLTRAQVDPLGQTLRFPAVPDRWLVVRFADAPTVATGGLRPPRVAPARPSSSTPRTASPGRSAPSPSRPSPSG
jgi:hypothetical protein